MREKHAHARPSHGAPRPPREAFPRRRKTRGKTLLRAVAKRLTNPPCAQTRSHRAKRVNARENTAQNPLPRRSETATGGLRVTEGHRRAKRADARVNACSHALARTRKASPRANPHPRAKRAHVRVYTPRGPRRASCKRRTTDVARSFTGRTTEAPFNLRKRGRVKKCSICLHTKISLVYTGKSGAASPLPGLLRLTAPCTRNVCESGAKKSKRA